MKVLVRLSILVSYLVLCNSVLSSSCSFFLWISSKSTIIFMSVSRSVIIGNNAGVPLFLFSRALRCLTNSRAWVLFGLIYDSSSSTLVAAACSKAVHILNSSLSYVCNGSFWLPLSFSFFLYSSSSAFSRAISASALSALSFSLLILSYKTLLAVEAWGLSWVTFSSLSISLSFLSILSRRLRFRLMILLNLLSFLVVNNLLCFVISAW